MDPVRILQVVIAYLNDHEIDDERMITGAPDEVEEMDDGAEVRISWGGRDLFDLTIKRV